MVKHLSLFAFGSFPKLIFVALIGLCIPEIAKAQQEEILLSLNHPALGTVYVNSLYNAKDETVLLPVLEVFGLLEINYQPDKSNFTIQGNYITANNPYVINFSTGTIKLGKKSYSLTPDEYKISETDFYLTPKVLEDVFGLHFTVKIDQLVLSLISDQTLPIESRKSREQARDRLEGLDYKKEDFPMRYKLNRSLVSGTMLDYSVNADLSAAERSLGYTFTGGLEVLGGDLQGTVTGSNSTSGYNYLNATGLRWRYAIRDNDYISGIMAGQIATTGLQPFAIKGVSVSNDPIEPRQMYETYPIDGTTEPESEVEIYVNERLADFKRADELGYYRFDVPITYGTTRISLKIYTPSGKIIVSDKQMQVPFNFLPKGVVSYNFQAGQTESYMSSDTLSGQLIAHGNVAMGLTKWLTASLGSQYLGNSVGPGSFEIYSSISARIAKQYLVNIDASPNYFYRFTGSVMYPNNLNLNVIYTRFDGLSIYNSRNATDYLNTNMYFPFRIFGLSTGFRISGDYFTLPSSTLTMYRTDLNARVGSMDIRLNYYDNLVTSNNNTSFGQGLLTGGLTYTIARSPGIPVYVRGMYTRFQTSYNVHKNSLEQSEVNISRTLLKTGRIDLSFAYNYQLKTTNSRIGLTFDLSSLRSVTTAYLTGKNLNARQSITGSIGWDVPNEKVVTSNRQQVGRSAVAVIMYVDNNSSGSYDQGDQLLPYKAVKLDQTATLNLGSDSILRLTQLQSYYKYNLAVNRSAIPDPTLVPIIDKFSFIADPNQYKQIEIPFYRGGIAEGSVLVARDGKEFGQGGLRILLKAVGKDFQTVVRTMSDGNFYVMDLAPGKYTMEIDPIQLGFLNVKCEPEKVEFEIKALADGDYVEDLNITLTPIEAKKEVVVVPKIQPNVVKDSVVTKVPEPIRILQKDTTPLLKQDTIIATKIEKTSIRVDTTIAVKDTTASIKIEKTTAPKDTTVRLQKDTIPVPSKLPLVARYKGLILPKYLGEPLILRNKQGKYSINFGSFSQKKQTKTLVDLINKKSPDKTLIVNKNGHYLVSLGYFDNRKIAEKIKASIVFKKKSKR